MDMVDRAEALLAYLTTSTALVTMVGERIYQPWPPVFNVFPMVSFSCVVNRPETADDREMGSVIEYKFDFWGINSLTDLKILVTDLMEDWDYLRTAYRENTEKDTGILHDTIVYQGSHWTG